MWTDVCSHSGQKALFVIETCLKHNVAGTLEAFQAETALFEELSNSETGTMQTQAQKVLRALTGTGSPATSTRPRPTVARVSTGQQQSPQTRQATSLVDVGDEPSPVPSQGSESANMFADMTPVDQTSDMFAQMTVQQQQPPAPQRQVPQRQHQQHQQQAQSDLWIDVGSAPPSEKQDATSFLDQLDPLKNPQAAQVQPQPHPQQQQPQQQQQMSPSGPRPGMMQQPYMGPPGMYPPGYGPAMYAPGYGYAVPMAPYAMYQGMQGAPGVPFAGQLRQRTSSFGASPAVAAETKKEETGFEFIGKKDSFDFVADEMSRQVKST